MKLLFGDGRDEDFVGDASQERGVHQLLRLEIGGEDDHQLERDLEFQTIAQGEIIDAAIHGQDPAVQQHGGRR